MIIKKEICYIVDNYSQNLKIVGIDKTDFIIKNIKDLFQSNCLYYGSSLIGRKKAAKIILKKNYKIPILINENLICFKIENKNSNIYIFFNNIKDYLKINSGVKIIFINNHEIIVNLKFEIFQHHIYKCAYLYSYFKKLKK